MSTVCIPYLHCMPLIALYGQLLLGLINGSFYALLSLGLAVIFGMLQVVNFAHGALYMLGAFVSWWLLSAFGVNYWAALAIAPLIVALLAMAMKRSLLRHIYQLDPLYGLLLTFGVAQLLEGALRYYYGSAGQPYSPPDALQSAIDLGFIILPIYRAWVVVVSIVVCLATWLLMSALRSAPICALLQRDPTLVEYFGVNVPLIMTLTFTGWERRLPPSPAFSPRRSIR